MITKIISGGQTGPTKRPLISPLNITFPMAVGYRRAVKQKTASEKYRLQEMPTASYPKRTEKNILYSDDGAIIFSRGELTGASARTQKLPRQHGQFWRHIYLHSQKVKGMTL